ncbi:HET-domain-containing protein, partial [Hyaloscypha variabilis F]
LHLAKLWLKDCEEDHGSCNKSLGSSFLPTRVLSIRNTSPRLCLTSALPRTELVRYAALSHCWGSLDDLIRLTKANLIEFQREIPPTALCKTFRDAIEITKALGLDYLWIDSLCIIQDDGEDWKIEASLMCEVYSCCAVSIAASSAENGNGGCLFPRDPQRRWIQRVEVITEKAPAEFILLNRGISKQCIEDTPLATRAWALQEHVLAPRTLHFSSSQIYWECREKQACESLPRGLPGYHFGSNVKTWLDWAPIVQEYSSRTLTYPGDKLPALAGLAEKVHEETKNTYIAGLWLETLAWDLLWTTAAVVYQYQKPKYSNGPLDLEPSWSWAAVDSPV